MLITASLDAADPLPTKIVIFSDSHGNSKGIKKALTSAGSKVSHILHLGDGLVDGKLIAESCSIPFTGVRGNEDYGDETPEIIHLESNGWKIMLLHGHQLDINAYQAQSEWEQQIQTLADTAREAGASCLLFGHTHHWYLNNKNGILICNPGSQYIGSQKPHTFAILRTTKDYLNIDILEEFGTNQWRVKSKSGISI